MAKTKREKHSIRFYINNQCVLFELAAFRNGQLRLNLTSSEQCDGCGRDICESGTVNERAETIECECGTLHSGTVV